MHQPTITQKLLLLCHRTDTGRPLVGRTHMACGIAGAMVTDLVLGGHVSIENDRITARPGVGVTATGDPNLSALLDQIPNKRPRTVKWWIRRTQSGALRDEALRSAVATGVLRHEQGRVRGVFATNNYVPADPQRRAQLRQRMAAALRGESAHSDEGTIALLALCNAVRADRKLFTEFTGGQRRRLVKRVTRNEQIGHAVASVIESVQAATAKVPAARVGAAAGAVVGDAGGGG